MNGLFRKITCRGDTATKLDDEDKEEDSNPRGNWSNKAEFTLSSMGFAIGLGNLWRFPYLCMRNGGGAFLVPYWTFMLICGVPMFYLELILGQFSGQSSLTVWKICPLFTGIGWSMIVVCAIFTINYNILFAWVLYFLGMSFRSEVPWKSCGNAWNSEICQSLAGSTDNNTSPQQYLTEGDSNATSMNTTTGNRTAAEEFFLYNVLNISPGIDDVGEIQWHLLLALLGAVTITFFAMSKGIKSSGKVVYLTVSLPYLLLTILLVRGVTLPGSLQGIKYYLVPDWSKLLEFRVWTEACLQVFFTLGPAWGGLITLSSYNRFHNNCLRDSIIVCVSCGVTSFYAGFIIFSIIGFMAHDVQKPIEDVIEQGPGLAFVAYPAAISRLPGSPFWAVCFFLILVTLVIDSQFAAMETVISSFMDIFPKALQKRKTLFVGGLSVLYFVLGLPLTTRGGIYVFQLMDWYSYNYSVVAMALLECILVCYFYGIGRFYSDMTLITRKRPSYLWAVCWCVITPFLLVLMLVVTGISMAPPTNGDYVFPRWSEAVGWTLSYASIVPIPLVALYKLYTAKGSFLQRLSALVTPQSDWLPVDKRYHGHYKATWSNTSWKQRFSFKNPPPVTEEQFNLNCDQEKISSNA